VQCRTKSLVFETDVGRTLAGADASMFCFVVFIAFFWNRCPSPCRMLLASQMGEDSEAVREVQSTISES
jgi:hypothetical protein